jgi:hypothetical protein
MNASAARPSFSRVISACYARGVRASARESSATSPCGLEPARTIFTNSGWETPYLLPRTLLKKGYIRASARRDQARGIGRTPRMGDLSRLAPKLLLHNLCLGLLSLRRPFAPPEIPDAQREFYLAAGSAFSALFARDQPRRAETTKI